MSVVVFKPGRRSRVAQPPVESAERRAMIAADREVQGISGASASFVKAAANRGDRRDGLAASGDANRLADSSARAQLAQMRLRVGESDPYHLRVSRPIRRSLIAASVICKEARAYPRLGRCAEPDSAR